jgi:hypothetical protein
VVSFPDGFVDETLKTLSSIVPPLEEDSKKWFRKVAAIEKLDFSAHKCRPLLQAGERQVDQVMFWGDRLAILKEVFDESEP